MNLNFVEFLQTAEGVISLISSLVLLISTGVGAFFAIKGWVKAFKEKDVKLVSNGTDNHLLLVDVKSSFNVTGKEAEKILDEIHITCNKNTIPNDPEKPMITSGIRIGTPAMTTRGLKENDFIQITDIIVNALKNPGNKKMLNQLND